MRTKTQPIVVLGLALFLAVAPTLFYGQNRGALTMTGLDREFSAERVENPWSATTEGSILERIAQISGLDAVLVRVECRTSMCLLQLVETRKRGDERPYGSFYAFAESFGLGVLGVRVQASADTETSVAYLGREQPVQPHDASPMTWRTVASICCFGAIAAAALLVRSIVQTDNDIEAPVENDAANSVETENSSAQSITSGAEAAMRSELRGPAFVVQRSGSGPLSAAGQCSRGQVYASVTPNVPFRSFSATVFDIRVSGRIPRAYEFFVDAVNDEVIRGHFDAGDECTLRLVGPRGLTDPAPLRNPENA